MVKVPAAQPAPRVPRSRRDDRYDTGHPAPPKRATAGYVVSIQDDHDTVTVDVLDEELTGVIPLGDMPPLGAIVEVEARGDLLVIPVWFEGPPPVEPPYAFTAGRDPSAAPDAVFEAAVIPSFKDDSDATFMHFDDTLPTDHDTLKLTGNPEVIPAEGDSPLVTSIVFTVRARSAPTGEDPRGLRVNLQPGTAGTAGAMIYSAIDPGFVIPTGSGWFTVTTVLDEAAMTAALGPDLSEWYTPGSVSWTNLAGFVDVLRANGPFTLYLFPHTGEGPWDISKADLTFTMSP